MSEVFNFFRERISQTSKPSHAHTHIKVLPFDETGRDVPGVGISDYGRTLTSNTLWRTVFRVLAPVLAVEFYKHGVIDVCPKHSFNGGQVYPQSVSCELNAVSKSGREIVNECLGVFCGSFSNEPGNSQFAVGINCDPSPNISKTKLPDFFFWYVLTFRITERPNFITLNMAAIQSIQVLALIAFTCRAKINEQFNHGVLGNPRHSYGRANGVSFNQCRDNLRSFLRGQCVHGWIVLERSSNCQEVFCKI